MTGAEVEQKQVPGHLPPFWRRTLTPSGMVFGTIGVLAVLYLGLIIAFKPGLLGAVVHLLAGWFLFIWRVLPLVQLNPSLVISSLISLAVAMWFLHRAVVGLCSRSGAKPKWTIRHTLSLTTLILVLFGAAIAVTGVGHQMAWLKRGPLSYDFKNDKRVLMIARDLCAVLEGWANDHDGQYPLTLQQLVPMYMDEEVFFNYCSWSAFSDGEAEPLVYLGGLLTASAPGNLPLLVSPRPFASGRYLVARKNGSVRAVSPEVYQQAMADWRSHLAAVSLTK